MDLLFKRYASPFLLLDNYISICGLSDFINDFLDFSSESDEWEYFLHKVSPDISWGEFKESLKPANNKPVDLGATLNRSKSMLLNFTPPKEGE